MEEGYSGQLANKQVFCSVLIAAARAGPGDLHVNKHYYASLATQKPLPGKLIIIDQLISQLDGKRQKLPASLSGAKKHLFKKAS